MTKGTKPTRRGHNEGTFRRRQDGLWEARLSLPNGKRKSVYGRTRRDAQDKLRAAQRDLDAGLDLSAERQTLAQYVERWLSASVKPSVKVKTYEGYESILRVRVVPRLGRKLLARLTPLDVQALYADLEVAGLSDRSIHHTHRVLRLALSQAVRWGLIGRNPCDGATPPRPRRAEMHVLTQAQVAVFLEATRDHPSYALYVLAITTGMRQGELFGLKWADIQLDEGKLVIRRALQRQNEAGLVFIEPKTPRSRRTILLSQRAIDALREHRGRQLRKRLMLEAEWNDTDIVFCNDTGRPLDPGWQRQVFQQALKRTGLPVIRFHDLRHTAATLLLSQDVHPKVVSEMLGHATISLTLDTYSHLVPAMHAQAAAAMDVLLGA